MQTSVETCPAWSGRPGWLAEDLMVISVHVADTRTAAVASDWRHTGLMETETGDVEHHFFRRA
jgi:hypothetical protein